MLQQWKQAANSIQRGGVVVALTDTIFGILGSAQSKKTVEKIYRLKERDLDKPFIILITDSADLKSFGVSNYKDYARYLKPKTSIIIPVSGARLAYLHRGKQSLAFRLVGKKNKYLHTLIQKVGPLVAPSANPQGLEPAKSVVEARAYFGNNIDLYISGYRKAGKPSTIISFVTGKPEVLRK